ncbi:MAG: GTP cyclohydrolase I FolE [Anaerolineales bacterium]|nr:GTP cyclohydrolase I FolE [Anaerolineales bacterium]MDW8161559.1 GTP cyclohydrolase I FolE [Anaerolineales bacterium]
MDHQPFETSQLFAAPQPFILIEGEIKPADSIQQAVHQILLEIGEDPTREGLLHTPERVARMYEELTSGYRIDPDQLINGALFDIDYADMVLVREIDFYSLCEHHLLPFFGKVHVAYIPDKKVIGLSKIPRIVEMFARRLQVQERMTNQIADLLEAKLQPKGLAVMVEGSHLCAMMRGVKKSQATMTTTTMRGLFRTDAELRREFYTQLGLHSNEE